MYRVYFAAPLLIAMIILVSGCIQQNGTLSFQNEIRCEIKNDGVDPCPQGYVCYWSRECPKGADCTSYPVKGDLMCHKTCTTDADCPSNMPQCKNVPISKGDVIIPTAFCIK